MADNLLSLHLTDRAKFAYSTLGSEDRRRLDGWFEHLRHWRDDEYVRSKSERLKTQEELYFFHTGADWVIAFRLEDGKVDVLQIFREETLRMFAANSERATP